MMRCAKNASTITIMIGTSAPLRVIRFIACFLEGESACSKGSGYFRNRVPAYQGRFLAPAGSPRRERPPSAGLQGADVVEVAVALVVVEPVADRELVRDL